MDIFRPIEETNLQINQQWKLSFVAAELTNSQEYKVMLSAILFCPLNNIQILKKDKER